MLGIAFGLLLLVVGAVIFMRGHRPTISIIYLGMRETPWPDGPRPLFVITNPLSYRITWTMLAPEFDLASGWTITQIPKVRFGGETLEPGTGFEIYGMAATNVAYRYPVLWGMHPADALRRPKWKRVADDWCERFGIQPLFLPHGIRRSPVIPSKSPNQSGAAPAVSPRDRSEAVLSQLQPLGAQEAQRAFEHAQRFQRDSGITHSADVSDEDGCAWLRERQSGLSDVVTISWSPDCALRTSWRIFTEHWSDFCYPSCDDVTVWPDSERWVLFYHHEDQFEFIQRPSA